MPRIRVVQRTKHVHKLKRHTYQKTGNSIFFCTLPDCHYKIEVALALGKNSICNICGDEFIIGERTLSLVRPHCEGCGKTRIRKENGKIGYAKKVSNRVLGQVAVGSANELRERLNNATAIVSEDDLDI